MAILKGIEVQIKSRGRPIPEYDDPDEDSQTDSSTSKYIEAKPGDQFEFTMQYPDTAAPNPQCKAMSFNISIDGHYVRSAVMSRFPHVMTIEGAHSGSPGNYVERSFVFADLDKAFDEAVPNDAVADYKTKFGKVGCIEVSVYRCSRFKMTKTSAHRAIVNKVEALEHQDVVVPAKAVAAKVNTVRTRLGAPREAKPSFCKVDFMDGRGEEYAIFRFHYRTHDALQLLRVIAEPSAPEASLEDCDIDEMTNDQRIEMLRKLQEREKFMPIAHLHSFTKIHARMDHALGPRIKREKGVKREYDDDDDDCLEVIGSKRVNRASKPRSSTSASIEVIELD